MTIGGLCQAPATVKSIDNALEQAKWECRQVKWNIHHTYQLKELSKMTEGDIKEHLAPARALASTAVANLEIGERQLRLRRAAFYVAAGVQSILTLIFVAVCWLLLFRKRETLQEAFGAIHNIHLHPTPRV